MKNRSENSGLFFCENFFDELSSTDMDEEKGSIRVQTYRNVIKWEFEVMNIVQQEENKTVIFLIHQER